MEVYYINHKNQKIDLGRPPCQLQIGNIRDHSNKYEGKNNKITRIYNDIATLQATVTIEAQSESEFYAAANNFFEITESDTVAGIQGRLYIGNEYLKCNVIASNKTYWKETFRGMENTIKLLTPYPSWCREVTKSFLKGNPLQVNPQKSICHIHLGTLIDIPYHRMRHSWIMTTMRHAISRWLFMARARTQPSGSTGICTR